MAPSPPTTEPKGSPEVDPARLVGTKLGNYRLERVIGRGRMGVVYLANDEALLRPTAIKVLAWAAEEARGLDPVQWFLAEARLVARINDPRVVQIYGAARQGDCCYIAMEYVAGRSVEALLAEGGALEPRLATDVLVQAASALLAAHRSGVVHRDVKPGNLLMGPEGITKLSDFGMALGAVMPRGGAAHIRAGTPFYTAPEIWRGGVATPASDLYSLGATYYHLLTGRPPFDAADLAAVEQAHLAAPPPDPRAVVPGLPASCAALVLRVLAKAPAERHASAQELMWDARRVLQDLAGQVPGAAPAAAPAAAREDAPAGRVPIAVLARPTPPAVVALPEPPAPLAGVLGFAHRPFGQVDPLAPPYRDEPLASVRGRLEALLADAAAPVILLTAPRGAGATTLLRRVAAEARQARLVLALDVRTGHEGRTVTQRLSALAGVPEGGPEATEGLLVWLAEERRQRRQAPLVVLDGVDLPHPSTAGLAALVAGALATRAATLVLGGGTGLAAALATAVDFRDHPPAEVALPPLDAAQVARYLRAWLAATRHARGAPLLLSPDAQLVLTRRSEGVLARVNALAENMLVLAASRGERTLTSWHALAVPEQERWADAPPPAFPSRPAAWPTPAAAAVLDAARRAAGLPPAPRPPAPPPGGSP